MLMASFFVLPEYSRMMLKLCLFLPAAFHLAVVSYIVLCVNVKIKYYFFVCWVSKVIVNNNNKKQYRSIKTDKSPANCDAQLTESNFKAHSKEIFIVLTVFSLYFLFILKSSNDSITRWIYYMGRDILCGSF